MLSRLADNRRFEVALTVSVVAAALLVGAESYPRVRTGAGSMLTIANLSLMTIFGFELIVRFAKSGYRPRRFLSNGWNLFDAILFGLAIIPLTAGIAGAMRLARLLRVVRLVRAMPKLRMLVATTLSSMPSIFSIGVLLGLLFYVYAVAAVYLFGANDPVHFGDLHTSVVSLFRVITLEDWTDIMYTQMYGCEGYGYDNMTNRCVASTAWGPIGAGFFISFVFAGTWVTLNLFIGVILTGMDSARAQVEADASTTADANATPPAPAIHAVPVPGASPLRLVPPLQPAPPTDISAMLGAISDEDLAAEISRLREDVDMLEAHRRRLRRTARISR